MRRLTSNRATSWPVEPPLRPPVRALRVVKDLKCEGVYFHVGQVVSPDSELVQAICREHPAYLEPVQPRD